MTKKELCILLETTIEKQKMRIDSSEEIHTRAHTHTHVYYGIPKYIQLFFRIFIAEKK